MRITRIIAVVVLCVLANHIRVEAQSSLEDLFNDNGKFILLICYSFADDFTEQDRELLHQCLDTLRCRDERVSLIFIPYRQEDCASCSTVASEFDGDCRWMGERGRERYGLESAPLYNLLYPSGEPVSIPRKQRARFDLIVERIPLPLGTFSIKRVWWSNRADVDDDGFYGSGCNLCWDANVSDEYTRTMGASILWRSAGTTSWDSLGAISKYTISGDSASDTAFITIPPPSSQGYYDFRIELYPCGRTRPVVRWGPKQAIALAAVPFESVAGDEPSPRPEILDAYWLSRLDADGDGYYRTGSRLTWITYIEDSEEHQVMAYIYADAVGTVSNTPIATLSYNCDNTTETDNSVSVDLPELDHGRYDFRIKLVDSSDITVVVWYVSDSVPDLQSVPLEPASEDSPVYSLADVRWSNLVDEDGDGYWREGLHFVLDVDVSDTAVHSVKAVIFRRSGLTATWNEGVTTNCFEVSGSGTEDSMPVAIIGCPSGKYDFRVDIYACTGSTEILASRGPGEDADMKSVSIESTEEDEATQKFSIGSVRWTGGRDADQDGYSGGGGTISWIPEMDGKGTCSVFARVYYRKHGIQEWRLLNHTEDMIIVGGSPGNTMSVKVSNLIHGEYDFKIDIIDCESGVVITSCGPKKDRDLARVRLETSAEDQPRTQTKRKAGRMFAGISGGIHVVRIRQNSEDTWKGLVSFGGAIRQIGTVGFETVVFFSDSVKIFEGGIAGLDIAPSLLIFGDALSFSAKMGVIWMRPKRIGPDFFRGRIDYISGYVGGGMYLGMVGRTHRRDKWRIGLSAYALYSEEKKYYWTDDLGFPDYPGVGDILTLGGPSGGISLLLEF